MKLGTLKKTKVLRTMVRLLASASKNQRESMDVSLKLEEKKREAMYFVVQIK